MTKHFLSIAELTKDEIFEIFDLTKELKEKTKRGEPHHLLKGKTLAMVFAKPSARTRISFEVGMFQLGGHALYLGPNDIGVGTREAVKDVARVLSRYNDGIMARLFGHQDIVELAQYATVPVINGLTDLLHPCQIMADAFTILEHRKTLDNLKVAFIGDGNNVANSWINFASRVPMKLALAVPEGYDPNPEILAHARKTGISEITIHRNPHEAVKNADVVYTDVWASMGQEAEAEQRKKIFRPFQVNEQLMKSARPDTYFMHCLPAHRNEEVTDGVIESPNSIVFDEAENRMHVQKAIMVKLMK
ncbi:MAG: ornithine carbamoyltransferase [candidate division KSB1 bacterium]|nr:ornithine carbamoyltransferase [candidate division KSB1 bacterium]